MVAVVTVHIHHLSNIPNFETSVIRCGVKLIIFLVKLNASDCVSVSQEGLDLLLVVKVPNTNNSIFSTRDQVLTVWRNCERGNLVVMTGNGAIELFSFEELFCLMFNIPKNEIAVFGCSDNMLVIGHPFKSSNRILMTFHEYSVILCIIGAIIISNIVEQFISGLQYLVLQCFP